MSRTTRKHLPADAHASRANTRRKMRTAHERGFKSAKADRKGQRNELREEGKAWR
jgi:hypothetical protein